MIVLMNQQDKSCMYFVFENIGCAYPNDTLRDLNHFLVIDVVSNDINIIWPIFVKTEISDKVF